MWQNSWDFFSLFLIFVFRFCIPLSDLLCADWTKDLYMYMIEFVGYYFLFFLFFVFCICILYFVFRISIIFPLRPCLRRLNPGAAGAHLSSPPLARLQSFLPEETTILIFYLFPVFLKLSPGFLLCLILSSCSELLAGNFSSFYLCGKLQLLSFIFSHHFHQICF